MCCDDGIARQLYLPRKSFTITMPPSGKSGHGNLRKSKIHSDSRSCIDRHWAYSITRTPVINAFAHQPRTEPWFVQADEQHTRRSRRTSLATPWPRLILSCSRESTRPAKDLDLSWLHRYTRLPLPWAVGRFDVFQSPRWSYWLQADLVPRE